MKKNDYTLTKNTFVIKIYKGDVFIGYVLSYRKGRNGYDFKRSKYIHKAIKYIQRIECDRVKFKLTTLGSIFTKDYFFEIVPVTDQEIRFSKLSVLKNKKIKVGLFKNKI